MPSPDRLNDDELAQALRRSLRELPDAPPALQHAAIGLWPATAPLAASAGALVRRVVAVLSFDSWGASGLAQGMRSLRSPTRHLLFSAEGRDIDLRIAPEHEAFVLAGQVLGPDDHGRVVLRGPDSQAGAERSVALDALGEFRLEGLPVGRYQLALALGDEEIVLPVIEVGDCPD